MTQKDKQDRVNQKRDSDAQWDEVLDGIKDPVTEERYTEVFYEEYDSDSDRDDAGEAKESPLTDKDDREEKPAPRL